MISQCLIENCSFQELTCSFLYRQKLNIGQFLERTQLLQPLTLPCNWALTQATYTIINSKMEIRPSSNPAISEVLFDDYLEADVVAGAMLSMKEMLWQVRALRLSRLERKAVNEDEWPVTLKLPTKSLSSLASVLEIHANRAWNQADFSEGLDDRQQDRITYLDNAVRTFRSHA